MGGYLLTDIDGSTERWERTPSAMTSAVALHNRIIDELVERHGGIVKDHAGDGVFAVFHGGDPLQCALDIQLALQRQDWNAIGGLAVRIGVHADEESAAPQQAAINRAARVTESGWGGQIVLTAAAVTAFGLPQGCWLTDLGFSRFKGIDEPLRLFSLAHREMQRTDFPPPRTSIVSASPAPTFVCPLFGRERECGDLMQMLEADQTRIVSLVGPGGNGKTRLAVEIGARVQEHSPVWFVPFEGLSEDGDLIAAVARALRVPLHGGAPPSSQVEAYLGDKQGLLILDNVDNVASAAAAFIGSLRVSCNALRVLITSRAPLPHGDAALYRVAGLAAAGASDLDLINAPSFQLFVHEVRLSRPDFVLDRAEYSAFRELCTALGGSPLALRLAAQWRRLVPVPEILVRIRDDLDFLRDNDVDPVNRQGSIRRVFEGSWAMLSERERRGLMGLTVFAGEFDALAAERGAGVPLGVLRGLERAGLIERSADDRFTIHALIKGYAKESLAALADTERAAAHALHADYYLGLVATKFAHAASDGHYAALTTIERENANVLAAWRYALESADWHRIANTAEALFYALVLRARYRDAVVYFGGDTGNPSTDAYLSGLRANCLIQLGDLEEAARAAQAALEPSEFAAADGHAQQALGLLAHARGAWEAALGHYETALDARCNRNDSFGCFYSKAALTILHIQRGMLEHARQRIKETFLLCEQSGNQTGSMIVHSLAADLAVLEGRSEDAQAGYVRSLELEAAVHHPQHRARVLIKLGAVATGMSEHASALRYHRQALACATQIGDVRHKVEALLAIGGDLQRQGQAEKAKIRFIQAVRLAVEMGARPLLIRCLIDVAELEADMGDTRRAEQLASVLAAADLGQSESKYKVLLARLPAVSRRTPEVTSPEAIGRELVTEADLAPLRL
ncbi:MAG: AAA family ATPase [Hyphomonadaceae bacterium]